MPDIDSLIIQVEGQSDGAAKSLERLEKTLDKLEKRASGGAGLRAVNEKLASIQTQIDKINTGKFGELVKKLDSLGKTKIDGALSRSMNNIESAARRTTGTLGNTTARLGIMAFSLRSVVNTVAGFMKNSMDYMENMNLFTVSMGKYAEEAIKYANAVSEVMGIDTSVWVRNQGVFMSLTEGFGVASDRAYKMSKNLTQLGYDLSSFYNISYTDAFQKLQSGISGELEPLRRLGIDLSEARLKAIALELGITKVYSAMTQAEKAQLRYHAIMTQTTKAQGDMARTLENPSNQLRVFKAAATQAARAIGNIFIPMLNAVLPLGIAVANVIRIVASAFASLLGFAMPTVDYSGINGAADAAGKLNENLGGAGGSAKELQKALMGFDEINKLPDVSGGGGGGGGGSLDGFDFELLEYDFLSDAVNSRVQQIMQKFAPALDFIKNNAADILQIAKAAGVAFLEWKVASKFLPDLTKGSRLVNGIKGTLMGLTIGAITIGLSFKFTQDFMGNSTDGNLDWGSLISSGLTSTFGSGLTGLVIKQATGSSKAGWIATGATLAITAATDLILQYKDVVNGGGWDEDNIANGIMSMLKLAASGAMIGFKFGGLPGAAIGAGAGIVVSLLSNLVIKFATADVVADKKAKMKIRAGIHLEQKEIEQFIKDQMSFDVKARIEAVDAAIDLSQTAKDNLTKSIQSFSENLDLLKLGVDKENSVNKIKESLSGEDGIISNLSSYLKEEGNVLKAFMTVVPLESSNGDADFSATLFSSYTSFSAQLESSVSLLGGTLADLLEKSLTERLTEKETALAASISNMLVNINSIVDQQGVAKEFYQQANTIKWEDLDFETFENAIDTLLAYRDETMREMVSKWDAQKTELQELLMTASNFVMPSLFDAKAVAISNNDTAAVEMWSAQIEALEAEIKRFQSDLDNWETTHSAEKFGETLLKPYADSVRSAANEIFNGAFSSAEEIEKAFKALDDVMNRSAYAMNDFGTMKLVDADLKNVQERAGLMIPVMQKVYDEFSALFNFKSATSASGGGGGGSPLFSQIEQIDSAFSGVTDTVGGAQKAIGDLGSEATFNDMRTQLALTSEDARGIADAIKEIPTDYAINMSIPSYSSIISRISNIANKIRSIGSGNISIKVKAGLDSGSKAFLSNLALVSPTSTLAGQLMELIELSMFAKGGFPKRGDLFIANESGPELVGRIGNKTAVANEDQIGDTILSYMEQAEGGGGGSLDEERLASVLVSAMKRAGLGALRIDGKDIVRSINRETQRTGHTPLTIK